VRHSMPPGPRPSGQRQTNAPGDAMRNYRQAVVAAMAAITASILLSNPAQADDRNDPCGFAAATLCRFLPMMPELEHYIDLTQEQPSTDPPPPSP
jgi:hypothetical protein